MSSWAMSRIRPLVSLAIYGAHWMIDPDELAADSALYDDRNTIRRLNLALSKAKASKDELIAAVYQAARDAAEGLTLPPVPKPAVDKRKKDEEVAIAVLSDWQLAKVTPTYNTEVCGERIQRYSTKVGKLVDIQRADHPVREVRVYLLGDLVEGELIFPGQSHLVDASLYRQVLVDGPQILGSLLRSLASVFEVVKVVGVIGNHGALGGRARKDYHPESNADAMMMEATRLVLKDEPRITWAPNFTTGERHWYQIDRIGDKRYFLFHGDQVKGGAFGMPWYGFGKKLQGWYMGIDQFDYALGGHFHTPVRMYLNGITYWGNGSTESSNTYAAENLAAAGTPCQWLLFAHPRKGITAEYLVKLDD